MAVPDRPTMAATLALCGLSIACVLPIACRADELSPDDPAPIRTRGLVLQQGRPDGTDLVTVRYALDDEGALRAYAGAGMNRAVHFSGGEAFGPSLMNRRNRDSSVGAAAEIGAEWRLSENLLLNADLRWFDIDERAYALRSDFGPVGADPVMLGFSIGYRFR